MSETIMVVFAVFLYGVLGFIGGVYYAAGKSLPARKIVKRFFVG